jgi:hypothetical protein
MLDVHSVNEVVPKNHLFKHLGHNPYSGALHYRCPACNIVLFVDPMAVLGEISLKGFPKRREDLPSRRSNNRSVWRYLFQNSHQDEIRA